MQSLLSTIILLIIIMDPFGNVVTINSLLSGYGVKGQRRIILREALIAYSILVVCALVGTHLLRVLGLQQHTLRISGGIVLFIIALGMVFPVKRVIDLEALTDPMIVPIAMPLIAGPSSMSIIFFLAHTHSTLNVLAALTAACLFSFTILWLSPAFFEKLGKRGAIAIERLAGMLLIMISVQMLLDGFKDYMAAGS
jgi:multiple antibiotic resistance protein